MRKSKFKMGQRFGNWQLVKFIGVGGNGEVWRATLSTHSTKEAAIKLLKRINDEGYIRFKDEVKVLRENSDIKGLLPIIDYYLPDNPTKETPWYSMPLATPLTKYIADKTAEQIIDVIILASNTLSALHGRDISHRDIKPPNLLVKDSEVYLSDFGLVEYPHKKDITLRWKDLGPRWTIAPEMRRNPRDADGKLADVYSLAKTLWILLTKIEQGFDGQYSTGSSIEIKRFAPSIYHTALDNLLHISTDHNPTSRPTIKEFADQLTKWKELNKDFERRSESEWRDIQTKLFPNAMPKRVIWTNVNDILSILNIVAEDGNVNHTLFPTGGGLDLQSAKKSCEEGCVELIFDGGINIVKPIVLMFECFHEHSDWNYFRLETDGLEFIAKYKHTRPDEGLTELEPCVYTDYECYEFDDYNGERLPSSARQVVRVSQGSYLICLTTSPYNRIPATYDGRHNKVNADQFRTYMEAMISSYDKTITKTVVKDNSSSFRKPTFIKSTKIRKGARFLSAEEIKIIQQLISLFRKAKKEYDKSWEQAGLKRGAINLSDEKTMKAIRNFESSSAPHRRQFDRHLNALSDDQLALIESVMYGGRDVSSIRGRAYPLDEMLERFAKDSRENRLHAITEKAFLDEYLSAGIRAYR